MEKFKCPICRASCNLSVEVNNVLNAVVGVFPINTVCGVRMLKRAHSAHMLECGPCSAHENKYIRAQLSNARRKLLKMKREQESEDSETE